jgi:hypothetical protein
MMFCVGLAGVRRIFFERLWDGLGLGNVILGLEEFLGVVVLFALVSNSRGIVIWSRCQVTPLLGVRYDSISSMEYMAYVWRYIRKLLCDRV